MNELACAFLAVRRYFAHPGFPSFLSMNRDRFSTQARGRRGGPPPQSGSGRSNGSSRGGRGRGRGRRQGSGQARRSSTVPAVGGTRGGGGSSNPAALARAEGGGVVEDLGDEEAMNEEEEELEISTEWAEAGVPVEGGSGMPEGEALPGEEIEESSSGSAAEPFARVGIPDFVSVGLGMGPAWPAGR